MSSSKAVCPIMNVEIDKKTARRKQWVRVFNGKTIFLCCDTCVKLFDKTPNKYTS